MFSLAAKPILGQDPVVEVVEGSLELAERWERNAMLRCESRDQERNKCAEESSYPRSGDSDEPRRVS